MGAAEFHLKPDEVRGYAKRVYAVADAVAELRVDSVLFDGAGSCPGTDLLAGLRERATDQHEGAQALSRDLDGFGDSIMGAIDVFQRLDEHGPGAVPFTDRGA